MILFSRFSKSFATAEKKKFPDGIGPVINIALFGIGRAGNFCYNSKENNLIMHNKQRNIHHITLLSIMDLYVNRWNSFEQHFGKSANRVILLD